MRYFITTYVATTLVSRAIKCLFTTNSQGERPDSAWLSKEIKRLNRFSSVDIGPTIEVTEEEWNYQNSLP